MKYLTTRINADFWIKAYGWNNGEKVDRLVGVTGLINLVGTELANKFLERAYASGGDKQICKLRRGLKITFYSK